MPQLSPTSGLTIFITLLINLMILSISMSSDIKPLM
nr:ATP synthase F0 subunit 8 [Bulinus truncatus]QYJ56635.1 ATP synthase F0 subunit 8 [Bulinus truncatus]